MDLLHDFNDHIAKEKLFSSRDRLLVAVSGGLDSVVLCELCHRGGYDFTIAHCNFRLRGEESERDEGFVRQLAVKYNREVLVKVFDTGAYAAAHKLSIQVAARQLRYDWFNTVLEDWRNRAGTATAIGTARSDEPEGVILTAHHLDDNIETLLMNFFKGTGITGLRAMLPRQGAIVRPLLFAGRAVLQQFALDAGLSWVEDSSNQSDKYTRNYFRHQIIPLIQQVYPGVMQNLASTIGRFREIENVYRQAITVQQKKLLEYQGNEVFVPVLKLKQSKPLATLVYEIITPFGFSPQQTDAVVALLDSGSGKYVCSPTHRILRNRNWLIISPLQTIAAANILVEAEDEFVAFEQGELRVQRQSLADLPEEVREAIGAGGEAGKIPDAGGRKAAEGEAGKASNAGGGKRKESGQQLVAWLDAAEIRYPLLLRKWQTGDYFYPLGMRKKKKLSRFFIDNKLSLADKEKVWVVEMDKRIVWVVGMRIDDRFRIGAGTKEVLKIEWLR